MADNHLPFSKYLPNGSPDASGELYGGVNIWFYKIVDGEVSVLFQKRSQKVHNGGFFDSSAGGHIDEGEAPLPAALRETKEEIGVALDPSELTFLCSYIFQDKLVYAYVSNRTNKSDAVVLDPEEVESVEWVQLKDFEDFWQTKVKPSLRPDWLAHDVLKHFLENANN